MTAAAIMPHTPVLVGIGVAQRHEDDPARALEPIDLMLEAVCAAGDDCGARNALAGVETIAVPRGRWSYRNPAREIARAIGANDAITILSSVGVLQQTLIADACDRIARGEVSSALVTGADAGHRLLRAKLTGGDASERTQDHDPDILLNPAAELRHPAELAAGLQMPVGLYAILESAGRARTGLDVEAHRDRLAESYQRFTEVAAANPHAWDARRRDVADIRDASARNPMQAFPYTRAHCSNWNVDQAAALLFCSAERAAALGIERSRWVFPIASAESNHMLPVSARPDITSCPGSVATGRAVLDAAGIDASDIDLVELYSCFPVAVERFADAIGLPADRDLTITGGMAFAGGPYNNYFLQATCRAAELLRAGAGRTALLSCVSGVLTKQACALWSIEPGAGVFKRIDVSDIVASRVEPLPVLEQFSGTANIVGCTVVYARGEQPRAVALVDTEDGARALATSADASIIERIQSEEWVGRKVRVIANELAA